MTRIVVIQGHPDKAGEHLCHGLADAYAEGAGNGGHDVRRVDVATLDFAVLRSAAEWKDGPTPPGLLDAQEAIGWAEHIIILYPLWLGTMPALLKAFLEQVMRPGFAVGAEQTGISWRKALKGKSARVIVTMGMPALAYRWWFGAHSLKNLERNILKFVGISPVRENLFGMVDTVSAEKRASWLKQMRRLGAAGR